MYYTHVIMTIKWFLTLTLTFVTNIDRNTNLYGLSYNLLPFNPNAISDQNQEGKNNLKQLWTTVGDIINPSKLRRTNKIRQPNWSDTGRKVSKQRWPPKVHEKTNHSILLLGASGQRINIKEIAKLNKKISQRRLYKPKSIERNKETPAEPIWSICHLKMTKFPINSK